MATIAQQSGQHAENLARSFLEKNGLTIVATNYSAPCGELDLIAKDQQYIVFVEVRYRKNSNFGTPYETIDWKKRKKLARTATHYLQRNQLYNRTRCRFDVVSITDEPNQPNIQWFKNAFEIQH